MKHKFKRGLSLILSCALVLTLLPATALAEIYPRPDENDPRYTVEFYAGSGMDGDPYETQIVKVGETLVRPETPKIPENYNEFAGWYIDDDKEVQFGTVDEDWLSANATNNVIQVHARFINAIHVTFYDSGDSVDPNIVTTRSMTDGGIDLTLITAEPTEAGKVFDKWVDQNGNAVSTPYTATEDTSLYATFVSGYSLVFNANGDGASNTATQYLKEEENTTEPTAPVRPGYTFQGWYTEPNDGTQFTFGNVLTENTTVYARWTAATANYTVVFWQQKVSDDKDATGENKTYDYVSSEVRSATTGATVNATNADTSKGNSGDYVGFCYGHADENVVVEPDGSTILNVYYDRNLITMTFTGLGSNYVYTATTSTNGSTTYYGLVDGKYVQLTRSSGTGGGGHNGGSNVTWTYNGETYTGTRYTRATGTVYTGLYGQTLEQNGYTWPTSTNGSNTVNWSDGNMTWTFMDAFILAPASNTSATYTSTTASGNYIYFYKQNVDGSWPDTPTNSARYNGNFTITDKYNGFTAYAYRTSTNGNWNTLGQPDNNGYYATSISGFNPLEILYKRNTYTIDFMNGSEKVDSASLLYGAALNTVTAPSGEGLTYPGASGDAASHYTFLGWYSAPVGGEKLDFTTTTETMPANNLVAYAQWAPEKVTVTYNANGGTFEDITDAPTETTVTVDYGEKLSNVPTPYNEGYTFLGWVDENGNAWNFDSTITEDVTLYAQWHTDHVLNIVYNVGNNTSSDVQLVTDPNHYDDGAIAIVKPFGTSGKRFVGWSLGEFDPETSSYNDLYQPGDEIEVSSETDKDDGKADYTVTLYAVYAELPTASITFDPNGGKFKDGVETEIDGTYVRSALANNAGVDLDEIPTPNQDGYNFVGWSFQKNGGSAIATDKDTGEDIFVDNTNETGNILYALWEKITEYTLKVAFVDDDGKTLDFISVENEESTTNTVTYQISADGSWEVKTNGSDSSISTSKNNSGTFAVTAPKTITINEEGTEKTYAFDIGYIDDTAKTADQLNGTITDNVTVKLVYSLDEKGGTEDNPGDGIPDKYQVEIKYSVATDCTEMGSVTRTGDIIDLRKIVNDAFVIANGEYVLETSVKLNSKADPNSESYKFTQWTGSDENNTKLVTNDYPADLANTTLNNVVPKKTYSFVANFEGISNVSVTKALIGVERDNKTLWPENSSEDVPDLKAGDKLTWTITVSNSGTAAATGLSLTDTLKRDGTELTPGATVTGNTTDDNTTEDNTTEDFTVPAASNGVDGSVTFTATYTVTDEDRGSVLTNAAIVKADGETIDEDDDGGNEVAYWVTVKFVDKNDINTEIADRVTFAADKTDNAGYSYTVNPSAYDDPIIYNSDVYKYDSVSATDSLSGTSMNEDVTVTLLYEKQTTLVKVEKKLESIKGSDSTSRDLTADPIMAQSGDTITWTITVTNTSGAKLENLTLSDVLTDENNSEISNVTVAPTGSFNLDASGTDAAKIFTVTYEVSPNDVGKTLSNAAIVKDGDKDIGDGEAEDDVTVEKKELTVTKTTTATSATVGDTITWTIKVENTGNVQLTDIEVTDQLTDAKIASPGTDDSYSLDAGTAKIKTLEPNESVEITVTYTVTKADVEKGSVSNTATAKAGDTEDSGMSNEVKIYEPDTPALSISKKVTEINGEKVTDNGRLTAKVGDTITWTITVENTGNTELSDITVTDDLNGAEVEESTDYDVNDGTITIKSLAVNDKVKIVVTYTVRTEDAGKTIRNRAEAETDNPDGPSGGDTSEVTIDKEDEPEPEASLDVTKTADRKTAEVGDTITWTIKVTNNGEVNLSDLTLDDTMSGVTVYDENGDLISSTYTFALAVGDIATFTAKYKVRASDEGSSLSNTVIVTVPGDPDDPDDDQKFEDTSDPVKVDEEEEGPYESLLVRKSVDNKTPEVGDTIEYTIKVTNTGDTTLRKVTVKDVLKNAAGSISVDEDDLPGGVTYNKRQGSFTIDTLRTGRSVTITYTYEVLRADAGKTLTNTVSASSDDAFDRDEETVKVKKDSTPSVTPTTPVETDKPTLNIEDHVAYIIGYTDGTVRPENNITRAEVATIFFRLLTDESRARYWSQTNEYSDVNSGDWFNNAISTLSNAGIITGYPNGAFQPNAPITRAEFSTIAARFSDVVYSGSSSFIDVSASHWAARYIALAEYLGWITGYPDGTFKPDQNITRAEAMTLINRVLERAVEEQHMLPDMVAWIDNLPDAWYYEAVQEATNSHEYFRLFTLVPGQDFRYEHWQEILNVPDWAALEKAWSTVNGK